MRHEDLYRLKTTLSYVEVKGSLCYIASPCLEREIGGRGEGGRGMEEKLKNKKKKNFVPIDEFGKV